MFYMHRKLDIQETMSGDIHIICACDEREEVLPRQQRGEQVQSEYLAF